MVYHHLNSPDVKMTHNWRWVGRWGWERSQWINRNSFLRANDSVIKTPRSFLDRKEKNWRRGCSRGKRWGEGRGHHITCAQSLSPILLFGTPWTVTHQAPLSMEFSRLEYWCGLPSPPPGNSSVPGFKPASLASPALAGGFFTTAPPRKASHHYSRLMWSYLLLCLGRTWGAHWSPQCLPSLANLSERVLLFWAPYSPSGKGAGGHGRFCSLCYFISELGFGWHCLQYISDCLKWDRRSHQSDGICHQLPAQCLTRGASCSLWRGVPV